ncbi:hypothetical protein EIN_369350 [Entamoeba invadens IP1]|uniref:Major facilitator superfamily (MFS) profile domain-containing protein n=1 Tax=Entamoeba invadens IP1 TaxID=370355 RepID=A0A0A1UBS8_ENTIV|nr:hypothetical protein EIN_369350 [Entamoeba invadens IP1]ELP92613.1 hypothetical protein EIN_369350 [Entamoeba invadens IP1]|eukprot:XP_004259384.1 hypothetical protein EIN_369350 [Entamoeba invadens IP1]
MNIAWEEQQVLLKQRDTVHRSPLNVILWALGQFAVEVPTEFTHRINTIFIALLIQNGLQYVDSLAIYSSVILCCAIIGGLVNLLFISYCVRFGRKKIAIFFISLFYFALVLVACWTNNVVAFAILLFFSSWITQSPAAMHGSQIPFISSIDLHQFADHLSILISTLVNFLYIYMKRAFSFASFFSLNGQALSKLQNGVELEKPIGTYAVMTGIIILAIILLIPYMFVKEHVSKPPIKNFKYNAIYIFNNFKIVLGEMVRDKNFILFLVCIIGLQYSSLYTSTLFYTVQSDIYHVTNYSLSIKENTYFYTSVLAIGITPIILHKFGPRMMLVIILICTLVLQCFLQIEVINSNFGYIAIIFGGFAGASTNVTLRRFVYENSTYDTISMHYGVVYILTRVLNSLTTLFSIIYQLQENDLFYIRFFAVVTIFFVLTIIGLVCVIFLNDHHEEYSVGLRPPYIKNKIIVEKE